MDPYRGAGEHGDLPALPLESLRRPAWIGVGALALSLAFVAAARASTVSWRAVPAHATPTYEVGAVLDMHGDDWYARRSASTRA